MNKIPTENTVSGRFLWIVALQAEAKPLIRLFHLRRVMDEHAWPVYSQGRHHLIVSGVGKVNAAMAAAWLLSREHEMPVALINFGLCGSNHPDLPSGTLLQVSAVTDASTQRLYLPDLYTDWPLPHSALACFDQPVDSRSLTPGDFLTCDMESAGIMAAGRRLLQTHQLYMFKVVSDRLEPQTIDRPQIGHWLEMAASQLADFLPDLIRLAERAQPADTQTIQAIMDLAEQRFRPSWQMRQQIMQAIRQALLRGVSLEFIVGQMPALPVASRPQGKNDLARWGSVLSQAAADSHQALL